METQTRAEREVSRQGARRAVAAATDKRKDAEVRDIRVGGCLKGRPHPMGGLSLGARRFETGLALSGAVNLKTKMTPLALSPRRRRRWRRWEIGLALIAITVGFVPGFYLEEKIRGERAWRAYERDAQQRGVKLAFADLIPPPVPDSENFASIPLFEAVFRASDAKQPIPNPFAVFSSHNSKRPKLSDPIKQQPVDLAAWRTFFVEGKYLPAEGAAAAADVLTALDTFADPLAQLREAGARPQCRFPVHWEKVFVELPHYGIFQDAIPIYALRLEADLAHGESGAAYQDFHEGLRLISALTKDPSLIAGLVRVETAAVLESAVWAGLARGQWGDAELEKIQADLSPWDWLQDFQFSLASERGSTNGIFDFAIGNQRNRDGLFGANSEGRNKAWDFYPVGWLYQDKVRVNRYVDESCARIDPGQRRWFPDRLTPSSPDDIQSTPSKIRHLLLGIAAPSFKGLESRDLQIATQTDHCVIACAIERFRLARGNDPGSLDELIPQFIPALPKDIVNGEPYRYRRTEDGRFVLYSVGLDLHDDGGVIDPNLKATKQKDWVWRYPAQ